MTEQSHRPELLAIAYRLQERTKRRLVKLLRPGGVKLIYATRPAQIRRVAEKAPIIFVEPTPDDPGARRTVRSVLRQSVHHPVLMVTPAVAPMEVRERAVARGVHDFVALSSSPELASAQARLAAARRGWSKNLIDVLSKRSRKDDALRRGEFAAKLAHDLANLLQVVDAELMITAREMGDGIPPGLQDAIAASAAMGKLIGKLRAMGGDWEPKPVLLEVSQLVSHFEGLIRGAVSEGVTVEVRCKVKSRLLLPPGDLDQILLNLATNSSEAMLGGGHLSLVIDRVRIRTEPGDSAPVRSFVRFTVTDTGPGIAQEAVNYLFEPRATTSGELGRGLGLSIVRTIVERADGQVFLSSDLGEGAKFQILLPEVRGAAPALLGSTREDGSVA